MTFLIYALLILWIPACVTAVVFIIRPSRRWPIFGTRMRAFLMLVALFFGVPIFVAIAAPDSMRVKPGEENKPKAVAAAPTPPAETTPSPATPAQPSPPLATVGAGDIAKNPQHYLELSDVQTAKGGGATVLLSGKIFNGADVTVRNPRLKCYLSVGRENAGTVSGVLRRAIPAGEEVAFKDLDMGDADLDWRHQVCEIAGAEAAPKTR